MGMIFIPGGNGVPGQYVITEDYQPTMNEGVPGVDNSGIRAEPPIIRGNGSTPVINSSGGGDDTIFGFEPKTILIAAVVVGGLYFLSQSK